jgi:hypothetical protein
MQAEAAGLREALAERSAALRGAEARHEQRCTSFVYQLQSAASECTAVAEEHAAHTLASVKKRVDELQARAARASGFRKLACCPVCMLLPAVDGNV